MRRLSALHVAPSLPSSTKALLLGILAESDANEILHLLLKESKRGLELLEENTHFFEHIDVFKDIRL